MKFIQYDHCCGARIVPNDQLWEVEDAIAQCGLTPALRMATRIRNRIIEPLMLSGWSDEVALVTGSRITITSTKNNIGLCLQTGNMSRMYADMLKLQKLYLDGSIKAGIVIIPKADAAKAIGDNIANYSRLEKELHIFRKVIHMPLVIYGFE